MRDIDRLDGIASRFLIETMPALLLESVVAGVILFVVTNIDDLLVLVALFTDPKIKTREIVLGQLLGIGALVVLSVVLAKASLLLPMPYVGLLGLVPIGLGLRKLVQRTQDEEDEAAAESKRETSWGHVAAVLGITLANGGDNIGVYTPVFAVRSTIESIAMILVFAIMTLTWCAASHWLVNHRTVGAAVRGLGHRVLPFALIAIGLWVLYEADSASLLE